MRLLRLEQYTIAKDFSENSMSPTKHILQTAMLFALSGSAISCGSKKKQSKDSAVQKEESVVDTDKKESNRLLKPSEVVESESSNETTIHTEDKLITKPAEEKALSAERQVKKEREKAKSTKESPTSVSNNLAKDQIEAILSNSFDAQFEGGVAVERSDVISHTPIAGRYCINVPETALCPSQEQMNTRMPVTPGCEPRRFTKITGEAVKADMPVIYGAYSGQIDPSIRDSCCYPAEYLKIRKQCVYGRPLMQAGQAKVAGYQEGQGWKCEVELKDQYSKWQKQQAGEFYLQCALFEHASIASFHQFGLELMRFAAPRDLLLATQEAILDEIRHAQLAFGLASSLLEKNVAPTSLSMQIEGSESLQEFALKTLKEGAVGESIAVVLAATQRCYAKEAAICDFLDQVIIDESKHAELAWETLRWCLKQDSSLAEVLLDATKIEMVEDFLAHDMASLHVLGILSREEHERAVIHGFEQVVIPSLQSLIHPFMM